MEKVDAEKIIGLDTEYVPLYGDTLFVGQILDRISQNK